MKLLSTLLFFVAVWVMAMGWSKDNKYLEHLENEVIAKQANPSDDFYLLMKEDAEYDKDSQSVQPVPEPYEEHAAINPQQDGNDFRRIYSLDMSIPSENCPSSLQFHQNGNLRLCGKKTNGPSCDSVTIPTNDQSYSKVLGKVTAYQFGSPDCFSGHPQNIESYYVDGISITHGSSPRKHLWTYAVAWRQFTAGNNPSNTCPSTGGGAGPWNFVGDNYFCASGNPGPQWSSQLYSQYKLWSSIQGDCDFCDKNDLSFCVNLETSTSDDLELRICTDESLSNEDIRIEYIDFYIG